MATRVIDHRQNVAPVNDKPGGLGEKARLWLSSSISLMVLGGRSDPIWPARGHFVFFSLAQLNGGRPVSVQVAAMNCPKSHRGIGQHSGV